MIGCEEVNYLLISGLIFSVYMYILQRKKLSNLQTVESALIDKAYFDKLTSLPNSANINIILDDQIYRCQRHNKPFYTALIKLNYLTNDVIAETGLRLFNSIRKEDILGYIDKGVFVIVFNEYLHEEENIDIILERINKAFEEVFILNDKSIKILIDIDVKSYPEKSTASELISFTS